MTISNLFRLFFVYPVLKVLLTYLNIENLAQSYLHSWQKAGMFLFAGFDKSHFSIHRTNLSLNRKVFFKGQSAPWC